MKNQIKWYQVEAGYCSTTKWLNSIGPSVGEGKNSVAKNCHLRPDEEASFVRTKLVSEKSEKTNFAPNLRPTSMTPNQPQESV